MQSFKNIEFKETINDRDYLFIVPDGAPLPDCYMASTMFFTEMVRLINEHAQKIQKNVQDEEDTKEDENG